MKEKSCSNYNCRKCKDTGWIEGTNGVIYCECMTKSISSNQWDSFGLKTNTIKKINDYIVYNHKQSEAKKASIKYVEDFSNIMNSTVNGLTLLGQSGSGKTHLIIAIGTALLDKGYKVVYMPYIEALSQLKANIMNELYYKKTVSKYKNADLLIIDDLFKDKLINGRVQKERSLNESDIKHIYTIINYRYTNSLPIVLSSEALPNDLMELDESISGRLFEKSKGRIVIFDDFKDNYRLKEWRV